MSLIVSIISILLMFHAAYRVKIRLDNNQRNAYLVMDVISVILWAACAYIWWGIK